MSAQITALYAECASIESIQIEIGKAEHQARAYSRKAERLRQLLDTRRAQIAAGTWPDTPTTEETAK